MNRYFYKFFSFALLFIALSPTITSSDGNFISQPNQPHQRNMVRPRQRFVRRHLMPSVSENQQILAFVIGHGAQRTYPSRQNSIPEQHYSYYNNIIIPAYRIAWIVAPIGAACYGYYKRISRTNQ